MNNREFLIHILLELRSSGIKNQSILKIIESIPPHYYLSFYEKKKHIKINFTINELIQIVKILELAFLKNIKYENDNNNLTPKSLICNDQLLINPTNWFK